MTTSTPKQLLHLVFGGELVAPTASNSRISTSWTLSASIPISPRRGAPGPAKAQGTVDNAQMRYFVVHIHRLMEPDFEDGN